MGCMYIGTIFVCVVLLVYEKFNWTAGMVFIMDMTFDVLIKSNYYPKACLFK